MIEAIEDIVSWLRDPKVKNPMRKAWRDVLADRIEAAAKRDHLSRRAIKVPIEVLPTGNAAAMREALEKMSNLFEQGVICTSYANSAEEMGQIEELYRNAKAALAEPPRNCDVGTPKEQKVRLVSWCESHGHECEDCPLRAFRESGDCGLEWMQMPYTEGES